MEVWWREVDEGVERWMVCVVVCDRSACVREVIVAIVGAPARSRRLRMRRVREVERGVGRLVEVDAKVDGRQLRAVTGSAPRQQPATPRSHPTATEAGAKIVSVRCL